MRKLISLVLVCLLLFCTAAIAEGVDLSAMSEEELYKLIDSARLELTKYNPIVAEGTVLYEDENIKITYTGEIVVDEWSLYVNVIIENMTDKNIMVGIENVSCNGWAIFDAAIAIPAGKKVKGAFDFISAPEDAGLTSVDDVKDIEGTIYYFDDETYDRIYETPETVVWNFAQ